jgi:hypothetical protein
VCSLMFEFCLLMLPPWLNLIQSMASATRSHGLQKVAFFVKQNSFVPAAALFELTSPAAPSHETFSPPRAINQRP